MCEKSAKIVNIRRRLNRAGLPRSGFIDIEPTLGHLCRRWSRTRGIETTSSHYFIGIYSAFSRRWMRPWMDLVDIYSGFATQGPIVWIWAKTAWRDETKLDMALLGLLRRIYALFRTVFRASPQNLGVVGGSDMKRVQGRRRMTRPEGRHTTSDMTDD